MNYLALDVGGTDIKVGIVDDKVNFLKKYKEKTLRIKDDFLEQIDSIIQRSIEEYSISGIGISFPGFINNKEGSVAFGGALTALNDFQLKKYIMDKFDNIDVEIDNDVNCVALAEKVMGNAIDAESYVCFTVGTGIGGAIFVNGDLYRGHNYATGEFGFIKSYNYSHLEPYFEKDEKGSLSTTAGLYSFRSIYAKKKGLNFEEVTGEMIFDSTDPVAIEMVDGFYFDLANLIQIISYSINPEIILIGGGISNRPGLIEEIEKRLKSLNISPLLEHKINVCKLKNDAGMIGAIYRFIKNWLIIL